MANVLSRSDRAAVVAALVEGNSIPHLTLKGKTPAQAAGVTTRRWVVEDLIRLLEEAQNPKS